MPMKSPSSLTVSSLEKHKQLLNWFKAKNSKVMIALSGGVDSSLLTLVAKQALGKENILTVTANYKTLAGEELEMAAKREFEEETEAKVKIKW